MTLILSLVTRRFAVQVSDRRLVSWNGRKPVVHTDSQNKLTLWDGRVSFGYTGLAHLGQTKTDLWLADLLCEAKSKSIGDALDSIASAATRLLSRDTRPREWTRLAFVGVGWRSVGADGPRRPIVCQVSNFHDDRGSLLAKRRDSFSASVEEVGRRQRFRFVSTGAAVDEDLARRFHWLLRHHLEKRHDQESLVGWLVRHLNECAARDPTVGNRLLSVAMPLEATNSTGHDRLIWAGAPLPANVTFQSWNEHRAVTYGPNIVSSGGVMFWDLVGETLPKTLGGTSTVNGERKVLYPCCYFFDERTQAVAVATDEHGQTCLGIYTDEQVARAHATANGKNVARRLIRSDRELAQILRAISPDLAGVITDPTAPADFPKYSIRIEALLAKLESLGGLKTVGVKGFNILYPCCYFVGKSTRCLISAVARDGTSHLGIYTDEGFARRVRSVDGEEVERKLIWNYAEFRELLKSTPDDIKRIVLNPTSPPCCPKRIVTVDELLSKLPEDPQKAAHSFGVSWKHADD